MNRLLSIGYIIILLTCSYNSSSQGLCCNEDPLSDSLYIQNQLLIGGELLLAFDNDSALAVLSRLAQRIETLGLSNSPTGLMVQARAAQALERDNQDDIALDKLLKLKETSKSHKQWDVFSTVCIDLARLYEKIGLKEGCFLNLQEAQKKINDNSELDWIYPRLCNRLSSYHRIYDNLDSAYYYATEVLRTAPIHNIKEEEGVGHMLMGMLIPQDDLQKRLFHYESAADIFYQLNDYAGYGYMIGNVTRWHRDYGNPNTALIYNDSTISAANKSLERGFEEHRLLHSAYKTRATIYQILNQYDSAWLYLNKSHELELASIDETSNAKVLELNAKFDAEQKEQMIKEQELALEVESQRGKLMMLLIGSLIALLGGFIFYSLKMKSNNRRIKEQSDKIRLQNNLLAKNLEQQIVLQGEIHHRVKNNLQVIIGLLELQKQDVDDLETKKRLGVIMTRIYSMAAIHQILYRQDDMTLVNMEDYVAELCQHFKHISDENKNVNFGIDVVNISFNIETSMPLGIMITELITNSLKHAVIENKSLIIKISIFKEEENHILIYRDNGHGYTNTTLDQEEGKLGAYLLLSMTRQLQGSYELENKDGAIFKLQFKEKFDFLSQPKA